MFELWKVGLRQIDDLHEYAHGQLLGEIAYKVAPAGILEPVDQLDRQLAYGFVGSDQTLRSQMIVKQCSERPMLGWIERQRDQPIGLPRSILWHKDRAVREAIVIGHHRIGQFGAQRDPVPSVVRSPHHRIWRVIH